MAKDQFQIVHLVPKNSPKTATRLPTGTPMNARISQHSKCSFDRFEKFGNWQIWIGRFRWTNYRNCIITSLISRGDSSETHEARHHH
jgi:hypothetical protein